MNKLLKKGEPASIDFLSPEQADAFDKLHQSLLHPPILALPRRDGLYTLDTDASDGQLGCCLRQDQPNSDRLPVGFWSRTLSSAKKNYPTTENECLAVVWSVIMLLPYLEGVRFVIRTDHCSEWEIIITSEEKFY